jgi:hypothetical protein
VIQLVAALAKKLDLAALAPAVPLLRNLRTSKTCMMSAAKDSDKVRKKAAFYNYFSSTTTKMSKRNMHDQQEDWLVEFITLCTGGETASQITGIDQLREVAWELLRAGPESLKKRALRIFATLMRKMTIQMKMEKNQKMMKKMMKMMKKKTVKKWRERASSF